MRLLQRLKTGLVLTKDSLSLMNNNRSLFVFPAVGGIAGLTFLALFFGVTFGLLAVTMDGVMIVGLFFSYLALTFVTTFFSAGLVHQTREVLGGNDASLKRGMAAAWKVKGHLFVWSLISATIGLLINAIENSESRVARLLGTIFGVAWTLMTFFVVPVIVFEKSSTTGLFKRSAETFKQTWGEAPITLVAINIVGAIVAVPFVLPGIYLINTGVGIVGIGLVLSGVLLSFLISQTLQGVVKTTLYLYARDGKRPEEFDNVDFDDLTNESAGRSTTQTPSYGGVQ
ncbi:DUF6159 family protein [Halovenus rubra]|uniref:DUF6159 family protein n=2 Tax=Halovenus rubra TaxID=869890 RepID=A0ACC7E0H2_9EURY|nr:DUF6159 family protein [Halovenus rubra]